MHAQLDRVWAEVERVLVFRNGQQRRSFGSGSERRYNSAFLWEERNRWFSDLWTDVRGDLQTLDEEAPRERSAAFPFAIPYRLINMYSVYGDTVFNPFWGTGTTSLAAMVAGHSSIGYEFEASFTEVFADRAADVGALSRRVVDRWLADHREFVAERQAAGNELGYEAEYYDFPVTTKQ